MVTEKLTGILTNRTQNLQGELSNRTGNLQGSLLRATTIYEYDYNALANKPQIESVELVGNKSLEEIGVDHLSNADLAAILT